MNNRDNITQLIKTLTENKNYSEFESEIDDLVDDIIEVFIQSLSSRMHQLEQGIREGETEAAIYGIRSIRVKMERLNIPSTDAFLELLRK